MGDALKTWWEGATAPNRALAVGMAVVIVAALIVAGSMASSPDYRPIFHGVSGKDASAIEGILHEHSIAMRFDDKDGTVSVPSKDESNATMYVEAAGILSKDSDIVGIEALDKIGMGTSTEVERKRILTADEGELSRKLMKLDPVSTAAVTISPGSNSSLFGSDTAATASVILGLKPGETLNSGQVKGIVNLVAHAVAGLTPQNVTLTDQTGTPLWKDNGAGGNAMGDGQPMDENAKFAESQRLRLQDLLDTTLGTRKAIVTVNAELDFDQTQIDQVQRSLPDGMHSPIVLSTREKDTSATGAPAGGTGVPVGSASNIGGPTSYAANNTGGTGGAGAGAGNLKESDSTTNYVDPNITHSVIQKAQGGIKKLTVAALVDTSVATTDIPRIQSILGTAIGAAPGDATRLVNVQQMTFDTSALKDQQSQAKTLASQELYSNIARAVAVCVVAGLLLFILMRAGGAGKRAEAPQLAMEGGGANIGLLAETTDEEMEALLQERPLSIEDVLAEMPEAEPRPRKRRRAPSIEEQQDMKLESIQNMINTHPESVALLMKGWMADDIRHAVA